MPIPSVTVFSQVVRVRKSLHFRLSKMIGVLLKLALLVSCIVFSSGKSCSEEGVCTTFDGRGFPYTRNFHASADTSAALTLSATGMRKKAILVVAVDVYSVGLYLSEAKDQSLKDKTTSDIFTSTPSSDEISTGVVLHFVRDVGTNKVVDAIVEALLDSASVQEGGDTYKASVSSLQTVLLAAIGEAGMKKDDEIEFSFSGAEGTKIGVSVRDNFVASLDDKLLRKKLGLIYAGADAVAPEVPKILQAKYA